MVPVSVVGPTLVVRTYALLDGGSTITVIDKRLAQSLGLSGEEIDMSVRGLWGGEKHAKCQRVSFVLKGTFGEHKVGHAIAVSQVDLPSQSLPRAVIQQIKSLFNLEMEPYLNAKPLILIGQDNWHLIDSSESRKVNNTGLAISRTLLGWALHGYYENEQREIRTLNVHAVCGTTDFVEVEKTGESDELDKLVRQYFVLDNLGILENNAQKDEVDRASKILHETTRKIGNVWETGLLWKNDTFPYLDTRVTALRRLRSLEKRQDRDPEFAAKYHKEMNRLFENGYAVKVDKRSKPSRVRYISHFGVTNPNKPGKVRLVFDAAEKTQGISMNDLLDTGPDLLESLIGVLTRFRQFPYAVKADIKDMYLRIKVIEKDRACQRFFYRGDDRKRDPDECEMTCLIFGSKSSPCSAIFVKNANAKQFERSKPEAVKSIIKNSYMDDFLSSGSDIKQMQRLIRDVNEINREANFEMHGWASNNSSIVDEVRDESKLSQTEKANLCNEKERVLGLYWDRETDSLRFNVGLNKIKQSLVAGVEKPTKREVLSIAMSVYDPLGILSPFTLNAKLIIQEIWISGISWDVKIREEEFKKWLIWLNNLKRMSECTVSRSFIPEGVEYKHVQLHVFCDASKEAFAAVAYLRIIGSDGKIHISLVIAKTRVAPVKPMTIPRLELQAAVLGARLAITINKELDLKIDEKIFWSDSTTILHWIKTGPRTKQVFVANRLGEINVSTFPTEWRWVPTELNPADEGTRQSNKPMSSNDLWLIGPSFLRHQPDMWPRSRALNDAERKEAENLESRKEFIGVLHINNSSAWEVDVRIRILGWERIVKTGERVRKLFYHWHYKARAKQNKATPIDKSIVENTENSAQRSFEGEKFWYRAIQSAYFPNELDALRNGKIVARSSKFLGLRPYIDNEGLLRARGRVTRIWDDKLGKPKIEFDNFENLPIILDASHYATKLLIESFHKRYFHANTETVVNEMRQRFYIVGLRTTLRWLVRRCVICRLRRGKPSTPPMADLPQCRLAINKRPFSDCGLDYFGPMMVKIGRRREKRWGVLFTCMTTRAIHLELAHTLNADSTLLAIKRLAGRRGFPEKIFSDNGTNFVKASKELDARAFATDREKKQQFAEKHRFLWIFNPAEAPHMGGAWERLIKSVKVALDHALGGQSCSEEVLITLLIEIEHMVNSRPLSHVSTDPDDEEALTPNHFLIGRSSGHLSIPRYETEILNPRRTFEISRNLANGFWKRWLREYLPTLLPRKKWHKSAPQVRVGDIVLILDYQAPRNSWKKGKVTELYPNKTDGIVRSVKVRTGKSFLVRPVHKLIKIFGAEE